MGNSSTGKKTTTSTTSTATATTPTKKKDSSGEFQKINMPEPGKTSPTVETEMLANSLAASGVLVSPLEGRVAAGGAGATAGGRRIVKAALKSPTTTTAATAASTGFQSIQDNDADDQQHQQHGHHLPPVMSPSASSEMLGESLDKSKTKMLDSTRKHQKTSRDKAIEEKRRKNKTGGGGAGGGDVKSKPQANPFSRFLSAFSVDAARPDHKRPYEIGSSDDELDESSTSGHHHDDATTPDAAVAGGENQKKDDNSITTKKRMKLDGSQPSSSSPSAAASNDEASTTASTKTTVVSIGGYDIDLTPVMDRIRSMIPEDLSSSVSSATSELPPWVGPTTVAVGAAAAVAGVAMIVTSMVRKK
mmetsp:Transcript_19366/g.46801  ORF Transcript_19366/g.46801 Transcript_19366/m.46801 type:complete len:361 (-) Transcript_19366:646-1728(-)